MDLQTLAKYEDQYVALSQQRTNVLAAGKTVRELEKQLEKIQEKNVIIHYVTPLNVYISH